MTDVEELVIGDVIEMNSNQFIPCDILLLKGTCLVNEALLTGESIPIIKQGLSQNSVKKETLPKSYLFGGTMIIHKKTETLLGVVVGTGWNTRKGQLLGSVIYENEEPD